MAGQGGVRRRRGRAAQLGGDVVVAARRREHDGRTPGDGAGQGLVGGGVAGVQGQHHLGGGVDLRVGDGADDEARVGTEAAGHGAVVLARLLLDVDTGDRHRQRAHVGEVAVRGEGQVGVAAAQVDHAQRLGLGGPAQVALLDGLDDRGVEQAQELLDLAVLRLAARLEPTLGVGEAELAEERVVLGQQPLLAAVVPAAGLERLQAVAGVHQRLALLGHPQLVALRGGLDVPVAERLVEQRVDGVPGGAGPSRLADGVVGGVRLLLVVRRDLQVATGLEVDVAQLDAAPLRRTALLPPGGDRAHERVGVEQVAAHPGQAAEQGLAHGAPQTSEAMTTISSSAPRATGMTRRR